MHKYNETVLDEGSSRLDKKISILPTIHAPRPLQIILYTTQSVSKQMCTCIVRLISFLKGATTTTENQQRSFSGEQQWRRSQGVSHPGWLCISKCDTR